MCQVLEKVNDGDDSCKDHHCNSHPAQSDENHFDEIHMSVIPPVCSGSFIPDPKLPSAHDSLAFFRMMMILVVSSCFVPGIFTHWVDTTFV